MGGLTDIFFLPQEKILAEREREELDRLAKVDEDRLRRTEQEKREQRVRLRELEKEKRNLIKERAREGMASYLFYLL